MRPVNAPAFDRRNIARHPTANTGAPPRQLKQAVSSGVSEPLRSFYQDRIVATEKLEGRKLRLMLMPEMRLLAAPQPNRVDPAAKQNVAAPDAGIVAVSLRLVKRRVKLFREESVTSARVVGNGVGNIRTRLQNVRPLAQRRAGSLEMAFHRRATPSHHV